MSDPVEDRPLPVQGVPVYTMRVSCMAYCYGGSPALELDEYPDVQDSMTVVKYADHVAAVQAERERIRAGVVILMEHHLGVGWDALNKVLAVIDGDSDE